MPNVDFVKNLALAGFGILDFHANGAPADFIQILKMLYFRF